MSNKIRTLSSLAEVSTAVWDGLANPRGQAFNPFVSHAFLLALEESGSATARSGWAGSHVVLEQGGAIVGVAPCYLKNHSMGEYVFDHGWADAFHRAGGNYYPKLQTSVPFTPATGPRLLATTVENRALLADGLVQLCGNLGASSAHMTFLPDTEANALGSTWLQRQDIQFHWHNNGFSTFDEFLGSLSSGKRKNIKRERRAVAEAGISFDLLSGDDLREAHWDHFFKFYMDTGSRKWGKPYLTRKFFSLVNQSMRENILLIFARREGRVIAGALNFIGGDRLFGRNWGCAEDHPFLHFETCYYQAIEFAIGRGLQVVEAGAQGEHKLARGYLPVKTHSVHHFAHCGLARAVAEYLEQERAAIDFNQQELAEHSPFKQIERE